MLFALLMQAKAASYFSSSEIESLARIVESSEDAGICSAERSLVRSSNASFFVFCD